TVSIVCWHQRTTGILREWIVTAGIQDDHIQAVLRIAHGLQHQFGFNPFHRNLALILDVVVHWDEKILTINLNTMTGAIEQAHTTTLNTLTELTDGIGHLALRGIF